MKEIPNILLTLKGMMDGTLDCSSAERLNAEDKLHKLLKKYHLQLSDIDNEETEEFEFHYYDEYEKTVLIQCFAMYFRTSSILYTYTRRSKHYLFFKMSKSDYVQFSEMYEWHVKNLTEEFILFTMAYISKHNIYNPDDKNNDREITAEQLNELHRIMGMTRGISSNTFIPKSRRLNSKNN